MEITHSNSGSNAQQMKGSRKLKLVLSVQRPTHGHAATNATAAAGTKSTHNNDYYGNNNSNNNRSEGLLDVLPFEIVAHILSFVSDTWDKGSAAQVR